MAGNLLTPLLVWGDFTITSTPQAELIKESAVGNLLFSDVYIDGRATKQGTVKIYARICRKTRASVMPAMVIFNDFEKSFGDQILIDFANKGYLAILVDLAGKVEDKEYYTIYPSDVSYANYSQAKGNLLEIESNVKSTCYYEWGAVGRYVTAYLQKQNCVSKIGGLGIGDSATTMWHLAATDKNLQACAFIMNAGWMSSKGSFKFDNAVDSQYSDNMLKFIAGVEPESYAQHVSCPTLVLSSLNGEDYDCDRVYDTVDKIKQDVYRGVYYTQGYLNSIDQVGIFDMYLFFSEFLDKCEGILPNEPILKAEVVKNKIVCEVSVDPNFKDVTLYYAENTLNPVLRVWHKLTNYKVNEEGKCIFNLPVSANVNLITFFASVKHKNGFCLSTNILAKKFTMAEGEPVKVKVVYSGREIGSESIFTSAKDGRENQTKYLEQDSANDVYRKNGPMEIAGIYCKAGLMTFKINTKKDKPNQDAILMLDVFAKEEGELTVTLICDYQGNKTEYVAKAKVVGGRVWHNVMFEISKFKTEEGRLIKSFDNVNAICFNVSGTEYLINNVLWI